MTKDEPKKPWWGFAHRHTEDGWRRFWWHPNFGGRLAGLRCVRFEFGGNRGPGPHCHLRLSISTEAEASLSFAIPYIVHVGFGIEHRGLWPWIEHFGKTGDMGMTYDGRELDVSVHHGALWWKLWVSSYGWTSTRPRWRDGNFNPADYFLGTEKYAERDLETVERVIVMPEGPYPAAVRMFESTWKRPRWPRSRSLVRAEVTPATPIPIPGKWTAQDATHALTCLAATPDEAAEKMHASVMRDRERRGGKNWTPAEASAP